MTRFAAVLACAVLGVGPPPLGPEEFSRRRTELAARLPDAVLLLEAGLLGRVGDDANTTVLDYKYLTGVHHDAGILALVGGEATVFAGTEEFEAWARDHLDPGTKIHVKLRRPAIEALKRALPDARPDATRLGREIARLRLIKSPAEIALIRKAAEATGRAHLETMKRLKPGMNEREVQDLIVETFRREGCPDVGFPPICGAGRNGTILHYQENGDEIPAGTLLVSDIGAAIETYTADITRTLPTSGAFTPGQRERYQCVLDAQKAAEEALRPGARFRDLERAAREVFEERGLTRWSYSHSDDPAVLHALGHYVGLSVHDSGGFDEPFQPGTVLTIEPGWYDKDEGYGIRIEDMYLVTKEGFERLSTASPREIDEIEAAMKRGGE